MTTYPNVSSDRPREYTMETRLTFDNSHVKVVFEKTDWSIRVKETPYSIEEMQGFSYAPQPGETVSLPGVLRVMADDIEYALTELAGPEY